MKPSHKLIIGYFLIGAIYSIYYWFFGDANHSKGFIVNLIVTTLVWPAVMFPAIGKLIGALVTVAIVAVAVAPKKHE